MFSLYFIFNGCNGQQQEKKQNNNKLKNTPNIIVNKEYDENGNLIKYDSTYSYFYSNIENDSSLRDSILDNFQEYFNNSFNFSNQKFFDDLFFEDSLLFYDFYKNDFFINRYNKNMEKMNQLFMDMDSIKNQFFYKQFDNEEKIEKP